MSVSNEGSREPRRSTSAAILALAIAALGAFVLFEAIVGPVNPGYAEVGPGVIPGMVGGALVCIGLALFFQGLLGQWHVVWTERVLSPAHPRATGNPEPRTQTVNEVLDPRLRGDERGTSSPFINILLVAAALILDVALMPLFGFVIASAVLFTLVAAAFGSRRFVLDAVLGVVFAGAIHLVFVHGLGLQLPIGGVWGSLPWSS